MSKKANNVAIGAFVAGALLLLFALLFVVGSKGIGREYQNGLLVFNGSVKGLTVGAPVALKGVQIGEVTGIYVIVNKDRLDVVTPVEIRIYADRIRNIGGVDDSAPLDDLIARGLRAQLQTQSLLTGLLYVQLDFHPGSEVRYLGKHLDDIYDAEDVTELPTIPTELERFSRSLDAFDFAQAVRQISRSIESIESLISNPELQEIPKRVNTSLEAVEALSVTLRKEIEALSPGLNETLANINAEIPGLTAAARQSLENLSETLNSADAVMGSVDYTLSDDSALMYDVREAAQELGKAGRALQSLAETLETQPESLLRGKPPLEN